MSGVRKLGAINDSARKLPNAVCFHDGAIPHLEWFRTRPDFRPLGHGTHSFSPLAHRLLITPEASRYGLQLPNRQDASR